MCACISWISRDSGDCARKVSAGRIVAEKSDSQEIPYTVADEPWPQLLGNHRVHVYADKANEAVWVRIPWRRTDADPG